MDSAARNQARLFVLVLFAFLPAVGLFLYASNAARSAATAEREQELLRFVHVSTVEYQRIVDDTESFLGALVEFPEVREGGPTCPRRLAAVLSHSPQYTTLSHIGLDGYVTCGSLTVEGDLYLGDRSYFQKAVTTHRFAIGDYAVGRITGKPTVGFGYPIEDDDGDVESVLAVSLDLTRLGNAAFRMNVPEGATFTVLDQRGRVMIRVPEGLADNGADTVGVRVPDSFVTLPQGIVEPFLDTGVDLDGVERRFAIAPLRGREARANGYLVVGVAVEDLAGAGEQVAIRELQFLAVAGLAVLILAWLFGHYALVRTVATVED